MSESLSGDDEGLLLEIEEESQAISFERPCNRSRTGNSTGTPVFGYDPVGLILQ